MKLPSSTIIPVVAIVCAASTPAVGDDFELPMYPGTDTLYFTVWDTIELVVGLPGLITTIELEGTFTVDRPGPTCPSGPSRDSSWCSCGIAGIEMTDLSLAGRSDELGVVQVSLNPGRQTLGDVDPPGGPEPNCLTIPATCGFDAFIEIYVGALGTWAHNNDPVPLYSEIARVPPTDTPGETGPLDIPLYDDYGEHVANLKKVEWYIGGSEPPAPTPVPAVSVWGLVALALVLLTGMAVNFGRRQLART